MLLESFCFHDSVLALGGRVQNSPTQAGPPNRMLQSGGAKASVILLKDNACQGKGNWKMELGIRLQQRARSLAPRMAKSTSPLLVKNAPQS